MIAILHVYTNALVYVRWLNTVLTDRQLPETISLSELKELLPDDVVGSENEVQPYRGKGFSITDNDKVYGNYSHVIL